MSIQIELESLLADGLAVRAAIADGGSDAPVVAWVARVRAALVARGVLVELRRQFDQEFPAAGMPRSVAHLHPVALRRIDWKLERLQSVLAHVAHPDLFSVDPPPEP